MRVVYLLLFLTSILTSELLAQNSTTRCVRDELRLDRMTNDPQYSASELDLAAEINDYIENHALRNGSRTGGTKKVIPVVFHVFHRNGSGNISDEQIYDQIRILNENFGGKNKKAALTPAPFASLVADCELEFRLISKDPQGNAHSGINRKFSSVSWVDDIKASSTTNWPKSKYLNIWVVKEINVPGLPGVGAAGFTDLDYHGILMRSDMVGSIGTAENPTIAADVPNQMGTTATHEIGHWLNVKHIWGDGSNCDDGVSDTPPQAGATRSDMCPAFPNVSVACGKSNGPNGDMFMNFMDYSGCTYMFTNGQSVKMHAKLNSSWTNIWSASNLASVGVDGSAPALSLFGKEGNTVCSGSSVKFLDQSLNVPTSWKWSFPNGNPSTSSNQNPDVIYDSPGTYPVTLEVNNSNGGDVSTISGYITVLPGNSGFDLPYEEGFEGSFPPNGWVINNPDGAKTWEKTAKAGKSSGNSAYVFNYEYETNGKVDEMVMPGFDFSGVTNLSFDMASARYGPVGDGFSDTLEVLLSTDCGNTWTSLRKWYDNALATAAPTESDYKPTSSQWRSEVIDLSGYRQSTSAFLKFRFVQDFENNIFIDNVKVEALADNISEIGVEDPYLKIFPNPSSGPVNVVVTLNKTTNANITVFDLIGNKVLEVVNGVLGQGVHEFKVDTSKLQNSVYLVVTRIGSENNSVQRLVLTN